ncbi:cupredoxin domain-containing protein [Paenibacillus aestuarii]|uniref:Cupredoxin domain-containing protein n=1 Tax=Paenibacillus aestuarii TaxID=516965 RepID=A0ABW0K4M5_9BACL|nr:cupredoxin domain-containing protein [Paenibacillus aestuarii]
MQKWIFFVLFILAGALGLGVLFQDISGRQQAREAEAAANKGQQLKIVASNWQFDNTNYTVKAGEPTKVSLSLKEGVHAVEIKGLDIKLDKENPSKQVTFDKPGTYDLECVLPCGEGHAKMKAKLVVQ